MNRVEMIGRITREPQIYHGENGEITAARYTLAVDRKYRRDEDKKEQTADFISCVAFGKAAEFANGYLCKGIKLALTGRLQSGSYTTEEGQTVYTTDVVVEEQEFVESKEVNEGHLVKNFTGSEMQKDSAKTRGTVNNKSRGIPG